MPSSTGSQSIRRSRDGCWTCKRRKKKCDKGGPPCNNCQRLKLACDTQTRLVWEDDSRRLGMSRRGPASRSNNRLSQECLAGQTEHPNVHDEQGNRGHKDEASPWVASSLHRTNGGFELTLQPSNWPRPLAEPEWRLLDHYVQRFSRTYPAFTAPDTPFLRILLPLAQRNTVVLDSLLALSGAQLWEDGAFRFERPMLQLRHSAIQGSLGLLASIAGRGGHHGCDSLLSLQAQVEACNGLPFASIVDAIAMDDFVALLATCVMLLLYEKLSGGDQGTAIPHLRFFAALFPTNTLVALSSSSAHCPVGSSGAVGLTPQMQHWSEALRFLSSLFLYNDLVRSISSQMPTFSGFYYDDSEENRPLFGNPALAAPTSSGPATVMHRNRFDLPTLMARCSAGDSSVTEHDIAAWDGRLDWFPSFALQDRVPARPETFLESLPVADPFYVANPIFADLGSFTDPAHLNGDSIISEMYRVAAEVYRRQCFAAAYNGTDDSILQRADTFARLGNLPAWGAQLFRLLPEDSPWQNCVLWPVGIVARELEEEEDRQHVTTWLTALEQTFKIRLYATVRDQLVALWAARDCGGLRAHKPEALLCG